MAHNGYGISNSISSADGQISIFGKCKVVKLIYSGDDSANGWIKIWDGTPASGRLILQIWIDNANAVARGHEIELNTYCANGISTEVNGANIRATIIYDYL